MMKTQEFRPVNANEKSSVNNIQSCHKELTKLKTQVKPKEYQCIAMDGYIIFEGNYHPDAIVTYKTPRKEIDYQLDKFPKELQEEIQKLQDELNLTKKQIKELSKTVKSFNHKIIDLDKKIEIIRNKAKCLKEEDNKQKQLDYFEKSYTKFYECLSGDLASFDSETKNEIRIKLIKLVQLIEDIIEKYLN